MRLSNRITALFLCASIGGLACEPGAPPASPIFSQISVSPKVRPQASEKPSLDAVDAGNPEASGSPSPSLGGSAAAGLPPLGGPAIQHPLTPTPVIAIEAPYKLGQRPRTSSPAEESERERWNRGGRGVPAREPPPPEGHPLPRVIIDIVKVRGPHAAREIERIARRTLWSRVVACYRLGAYRDQKLKGKTTIRFQVSRAGKVRRASALESTLADPAVAVCLAREANSLELSRAKAGSTVTSTFQIYPGDDPMPPPESAVKPGEGVLAPQDVQRVILAARPRFEACYRASLEILPELWGRLAIRFHLTPSGKVDEAFEVESSFPDERAARCVLREARSLELPPPQGGDLRFVVPLRLSPK